MKARSRGSRIRRQLIAMAIGTLVLAIFGTRYIFAQEATEVPALEDVATEVEAAEAAVDAALEAAGEVDAAAAPVTQADLEALSSSYASAIDTSWVFIAGFLVFFMQLGFAILETGMIRQTSATNALLENFSEAGIGAVFWWLCGFGLAFGVDNGSGLFGTSLFAFGTADGIQPFVGNINTYTMFFFQFAFAATASTITTGAMAERTNYIGHIIYNVLIIIFIYPIVVHWIWGGGWIAQQGFFDFAGGTVVHTVGAIIALAGAWFLGPRKGKVWGKMIPGHNLGLALTGTLILWLGWYGFNPGSTLGVVGQESLVGLVVLNTSIGGGIGLLVTMVYQYIRTKKWDLSATMNGTLAGLVIITPGCAFVTPLSALIIGTIGGVLVLLIADFIEKVKIDDAVGAFSVHFCGAIGTLLIGLFADPALTTFGANAGKGGLLVGGDAAILGTQIVGLLAVIIWTSVTSIIMFAALKAAGILRVNPKAEEDGNFIDNYEHGQSAWPDVLPLPDEHAISASEKRAASPATGD